MTIPSILKFAVAAVILGASAVMNPAVADSGVKPYANIAVTPEPLRNLLLTSGIVEREKFVALALSYVRQFARTGQALDRIDVDAVVEREMREMKLAQVKEILRADANLDGVVTMAEATAAGQVKVMSLDTNGDGAVSMPEMSALPANTKTPVGTTLQQLLALDPDRDGELTAGELSQLAARVFRTADANDNGTIATDEIFAQTGGGNPGCLIPRAVAGEKIMVLAAELGSGIPNYTVAGQAAVTSSVPVDIAAGNDRILLLLVSSRPMIWDVAGTTERLSRVVVLGPKGSRKADIAAGIAGVEAGKIAIAPYEPCIQSILSLKGGGSKVTEGMRPYLGRKPDHILAHNDVPRIAITANGPVLAPVFAEGDPQAIAAPAGVDAEIWDKFVGARAFKSVLVDFSNKPIVSGADAVPYKTLPGWAGLAQRVHDGSIVRSGKLNVQIRNYSGPGSAGLERRWTHRDTQYHIVKDISYFPPGFFLEGFTYVLRNGVPMPKGNSGVCLVDETGEYIILPGQNPICEIPGKMRESESQLP